MENLRGNRLPCTDIGTVNAAAACILILKLDELCNSCRRTSNTAEALQTFTVEVEVVGF